MRKVKPFLPQETGYTIVDNVVFDYILPELSANGWKVLCFIIRKTKGWQKEWDGISYTQIMKGTGIKSSATISKVLSELMDGNYIKQVKANDQFTAAQYALNTALEIEVANGTTLEIEVETNSETEADPTSKNEDTKQSIKQKENKKEGASPAPDYLDHVLEHSQKPDRAGVADPSQDLAAYMEYANEFLKAYHAITGLHAAKSQKHKIEQLAENGSGLEFWRDVVDGWIGAGWNPKNIDGMIDCYLRGEIPSTGGKPNGSRRRVSGSDGKDRYADLTPEQRQTLGV